MQIAYGYSEDEAVLSKSLTVLLNGTNSKSDYFSSTADVTRNNCPCSLRLS